MWWDDACLLLVDYAESVAEVEGVAFFQRFLYNGPDCFLSGVG